VIAPGTTIGASGAMLAVGALRIRMRLELPRKLADAALPELLRSITPRAPSRALSRVQAERAIGRAEWLIARLLPPETCLFRALGRYAALRRGGLAARFVMGVGPARDDIDGHAWVELDDAPWAEQVDARFVETFVYPARQPAPATVEEPRTP
jgi:hypothetical protein